MQSTEGSTVTVLSHVTLPNPLGHSNVMTITVKLEPGSAGAAPHRHPGPVFGYVIEGEVLFELEGEPERVIAAGESFWEPGGDVIHYQATNNLPGGRTTFVAVMMCEPGAEMLIYVSAEELEARKHLRHAASVPS
jgi:quercetin dioxygenase-like cupin family protein